MTRKQFLDEILDKLTDALGDQVDWDDNPDVTFSQRHIYVATTDGVKGATLLGDPESEISISQITGVISAIVGEEHLASPRMLGFIHPGAYSKAFRKWAGALTEEPSDTDLEIAIGEHKASPCMYVTVASSDAEPDMYYTEYLTHGDELFLAPPEQTDILQAERATAYALMSCILTDKITNQLTEVN